MAPFLDNRSTKAEMSTLLTPDPKSRRARTFKPLLAILTLLSLAASFYLYRNIVPFYKTPTLSSSCNDGSEWPIPKMPGSDLPVLVEPFEPLKRYRLDYGKVA